MPLAGDASRLIRENLEAIGAGKKARIVAIGSISADQVKALNDERVKRKLPLLEGGEVIFIGRHIHDRRIKDDGYTIDDVLVQIENAFAPESRAHSATALENPKVRDDGYGNRVKDRAVFECTARQPKLELYSIIPGGDAIKPAEARQKAKSRSKAASGEDDS